MTGNDINTMKKKLICFFIKHKDGKKEVSYVDQFGEHYKSTCQRCGDAIFYPSQEEELFDLEQKIDIPFGDRFYRN